MGNSLSIRRWVRPAALCARAASASLLVLALGQGASAFAQEAHVFDPVLSLTGSCLKSSVDEVPDPGPCPGVVGVDHPENPFAEPSSVTTDAYGNIYVANNAGEEKIDVFNSAGFFISEFHAPAPKDLAVDSEGNLYVVITALNGESEIILYEPSGVYEPASGEIAYGEAAGTIGESSPATYVGIAVNSLDDHLFANYGHEIIEYRSAAEGNGVVEPPIGEGILGAPYGPGLAIDASRGRIYASDDVSGPPVMVRVFELNAPHELIETIDGSTTPTGKFIFLPSLAVEESSGNLFVYDGGGAEVVYELSEDGAYLATIDYQLQGHWSSGQIAVDNGEHSPNGALSPFGRYLYVPVFPAGTGHALAFGPPEPEAPVISAVGFSGVGESEARIEAEINPKFATTTYAIEFTTKESFEAEGFAGASLAKAGEIPAGGAPVPVFAALEGLEAGTAYRFRISAENEKGPAEAEGEFATYPQAEAIPPCPNDPFRAGAGALLPDCRAYELVTPSDTNARTPEGVGHLGSYFATREASPGGEAVSFMVEGGSLGGLEATGSFAGDPYLASRTASGWSTSYTGPSALEAPSILPGSNSPDQGYSLWISDASEGGATIEGKPTHYVRYPDGHSALVGRGSEGSDPEATGSLISEGGTHIVFGSSAQLEPDAPPAGTRAIYDRTADEETHVVSLLPEGKTPEAGEDAFYQGASLDGKGVAFTIASTLYLRYNDEETYKVGEGLTFAGFAEGGKRIFYLQAGNLFAYEAGAEEPIQFSSGGKTTPVNVAADGSVAYFLSPMVLTSEPNPNGAKAVKGVEGKQNLYRSEEGFLAFLGTVTKRDVEGEGPNDVVDGLGLWTEVVGPGRLGAEPSRTTPDGNVLLFESRAALDGYDPKGHAEVYRYDFADNELDCLSCIPTLAPAGGEASLESISQGFLSDEPFSSYAYVANLRADGARAFFQSTEALVPADTDERQDVYEWEAQGVGSCSRAGGCLYLISSGQSRSPDYLYAVSDSGEDVFFRSADLLLRSDPDETPSMYDARVGGGFAEVEGEECQGEGCRPQLSPPPGMPTLASRGTGPSGNPRPKHCPKGKRKLTRNGKSRCVKKHHRRHRRAAGAKRKGAGQ